MAKSKSVPALVLGILATIFSFVSIVILFYMYIIGTAFSGGAKHMQIFLIMMFIMAAAAIIGIVGTIFSLNKSKVAGMLDIVSALITAAITIWLICATESFVLGTMLFITIFVFYTLAGIFGLCAKSKKPAQMPRFDTLPPNDLSQSHN